MTLKAAVGQAFGTDARDVSARAVDSALIGLAGQPATAAFVFFDAEFASQDVLRSVSGLLKNVPLFGFNSLGQLATLSAGRRSVVVALLAGEDAQMRAGWWPLSTGAGERVELLQRMKHELELPNELGSGLLLVAGSGSAGGYVEDGLRLASGMPGGRYTLAGGLAGTPNRDDRPEQIGGAVGGENGLAGAILTGNFRVGSGISHAWQPIGTFFQVSRAEGLWLRGLDNETPAERYANLFGHEAREWAYPPLNQLVRLYPLGIETPGPQAESGNPDGLVLAAPLWVEQDGSFRMSRPIPPGAVAHLMIGSASNGRLAVQNACEMAIKSMGIGRPVLALVFADLGWKMLYDTQADSLLETLRSHLGRDLPLAGGYLVGQVSNAAGRPEFLNQHLQVVVIGEKALG